MESKGFVIQLLERNIKNKFKIVLIHVFLLIMSGNAQSGEWGLIPGVNISESYDDNVRLSKEGNEQSDYVSEVSPKLSVAGEGKYTRLFFDYTMQNIFYKRNDENNATYHQLSARSNSIFIRDKLFLNASINYSQRNINNELASSFDNTGIEGNRSDVVVYSITPYFTHAFGQSALFRVEHSFEEIDNKSDKLENADTRTNTTTVSLRSGPSHTNFKWDLTHREQVTDYEERKDIESSKSDLLLKYYFTSNTYLTGALGKERYNYDVKSEQKKPEGEYWEAGFGVSLANRTFLEIAQGEHYYGDTKRLELYHVARQSSLKIRYKEEVATTSALKVEQETVSIYNPKTRQPEEFSTPIYFNVATVSLNKTLTASIIIKSAKTSLTVNATNIKRKYLDSDGSDESSSADMAWEWRFASKTNMVLSAVLSNNETSISQNVTKFRRNEVRFNHDHGRTISSYVSYRNDKQETELDGLLYRRNVYKIGLEAKF